MPRKKIFRVNSLELPKLNCVLFIVLFNIIVLLCLAFCTSGHLAFCSFDLYKCTSEMIHLAFCTSEHVSVVLNSFFEIW